MTKKRKTRRPNKAFRKAFGANTITAKNKKRGTTYTLRATGYEKKAIRKEAGEQTREAKKAGDTARFKRGRKFLSDTASKREPISMKTPQKKPKDTRTRKAKRYDGARQHWFASSKEQPKRDKRHK